MVPLVLHVNSTALETTLTPLELNIEEFDEDES
jgi:hypothetical protein